MERPDIPDAGSEAAKNQAIADIEQAKRLMENASVEEVDTPAGRKDVEVAFERDDRFHVEEGKAIGVYYEPNRVNAERVHIDWADDRGRLAIEMDNILDMTESDYYTEDLSE